MFWNGMTYIISLLGLSVVVAVVYSAAQEGFAPRSIIIRQSLRRGGKLLGVLVGLGIIVLFLSRG